MNEWTMTFPDGLDGKGESEVKITKPTKATTYFSDNPDGKDKKPKKQEVRK